MFPVGQPGGSSSHMYHVKSQQLVLHLGCSRRTVCLIVRIRACWRCERREGREKKEKKKKALNIKTELVACGQRVP